MVFEVAHWMGLVPLLWLALLRFRGRTVGVEWYWLAGVFAVSWIADTASHWTGHPLVSMTYPVSQAAIIGLVMLSRREGLLLIGTLVVVGSVNIIWHGIQGPDVFLRTVAWLSVVGIIYPLKQLGRLRTSLLVAFGVGWVCWMGYALWPGWTSWSGYQLTRLIGIAAFCWAATSPLPQLKLSRGNQNQS